MVYHNLKVTNFKNLDVVSYSVIKLFGCVEFKSSCSSDQKVFLVLNEHKIETNVLNNTFKFLIELKIGQNDIEITYCCDTFNITIEYTFIASKYTVVPLYVICNGHDGSFQAPSSENNSIESACKRITLCMKLLQCITAEKLYEHDLGRKTFNLEGDCQVFFSKIDYSVAKNMSQLELWENIGKDIVRASKGVKFKKYLGFLSCTRYCGDKYNETMQTYEDLLKITECYIALGGGDLGLFGTACLYTWPETFEEVISKFSDTALVNKKEFLNDSCYRGTLGACFSTTLGSVLHELYHTFGLGHTDDGIMARGFDNIYKFFMNTDQQPYTEKLLHCFQNRIVFQEKLIGSGSHEKFTCQKKDFILITKNEEVDDTAITKSCAVALFFHRWFNIDNSNLYSQLTFDTSQKVIRSTSGIRVIEIRSSCSELVLFDWIFVGRVLKFSFQIPENVIIKLLKKTCIIFVEDNRGSILKEEFVCETE